LDGRNVDKLDFIVSLKCDPTPTVSHSPHSFGPKPIQQKSNIPDLVVILNPSENLGLIRECTSMKVPTIGIVDTDTDPRIVTYAIPANMEVSLCAALFLGSA
jgi:small subunit ribosomal protein S2